MKHVTAWALTLLLLLSAAPGGFCVSAESADADAFFQKLFQRADVIGGAVLISQNGKRVHASFYGVEDRKTKVPVTENTVYKVASVSKMISAIGVMRLADAGRINLDETLPGIRHPRYPDAPVTLRQVMSHTSSLLSGAPYLTPPDWAQIGETDTAYFSKYEPGAHYAYSNLNGGILGSVIERVSGQSFNTFMAENVFSPIYRRGYQYVEIDANEYDDTCDPDSHYRASVGSLYISLRGMEKLGQVLAGDGTAEGVRILSGQAVYQMRLDQSRLPESSVTGSSPYGLCVTHFTDANGVIWYGHQGRWEGVLADLFFEPETQTVVVFLLDGVKAANNGQGMHPRAEDALIYAGRWVQEAESGSYVVKEE